jgi:uncharacterized protein (DUF1810 family)
MSLQKKILPADLELLGMSEVELESIFGKPDSINLDMDVLILARMYPDEEEWTYLLNQLYWGLYSKKLHLYLSESKVVDYYTHIYIAGLSIF